MIAVSSVYCELWSYKTVCAACEPRNPQVKRIYQEKALGQEEEDGDQVRYRSLWPAAPHRQFQLPGKPTGMDAAWLCSLPPTQGRPLSFTVLGN